MSEVRMCNGGWIYCDGNCSLCNYTETSYTTACMPNSCKKLTPTLYGYPIEHLAFVARVLEKEVVTPEAVANIIKDTGKILKHIIDEEADRVFKGMVR